MTCFQRHREEKLAIVDWVATLNADVCGTLKFRSGYDISSERAAKLLRLFWNKVDRAYFSKSKVQRGCRVGRAVFMHQGISGFNRHYHFVARSIRSPSIFIYRLASIWAELSQETDPKTSRVEEVRSLENYSHYCLHEFDKLGTDTLVQSVWHFPTQAQNQSISQLRQELIQRQ